MDKGKLMKKILAGALILLMVLSVSIPVLYTIFA